jgi:hypothetical protein
MVAMVNIVQYFYFFLKTKGYNNSTSIVNCEESIEEEIHYCLSAIQRINEFLKL